MPRFGCFPWSASFRFGLRGKAVAASLLALFVVPIGLMSPGAYAQPIDTGLQIFVGIDGTVPDWSETTLTVTKLEVTGFDATVRRRFRVTAFEGSERLSIQRAALGTARFLVAGPIPAGRVDHILVTFGASSMTIGGSNEGTSPRTVPIVVQDNPVRLNPSPTLMLGAGQTRSLFVRIELGRDAVLTHDGVLKLRPTFTAQSFTPAPENFLSGDEILSRGPTVDFPELGLQVARSKILDPTAVDVRDLTLRTDSGALASFTALRDENEALWRTRHGALTPSLVQKLASISGTDLVSTDVWINVLDGPRTLVTDARTPEGWSVAHADFVAQRRAAAAPVVAAASAAMTAAGATILETELGPAILHVRASRDVLEGTIARMNDVIEVMETPSGGNVIATHAAQDLVQEPLWLAHLLGAGATGPATPEAPFGVGLRIALAEFDACVTTEHEAFQGIFFETPLDPCSNLGTSAFDGHSTIVAGALGAFFPEAPPSEAGGNTTRTDSGLVGLFQGRMFTANQCQASERLLDRHPHLINLSCIGATTPAGDVREALDLAVFADRIFVAKGAANVGGGEDASTLPVFCKSYNAVCVGGYASGNTLGPGNFGDDFPNHRFLNDSATGREKPDLVGPSGGTFPQYQCQPLGGNCFNNNPTVIQFPNATYRSDVTGTSVSTPFVVGTAALLMANFPEHLINDPTLTRAVLMASASHSFPGFPPVPIINDGIDDRTGAGAPRGDRAREILRAHNFNSRFVDRNLDFDASGFLRDPISIVVDPGDKVRVVLTYDQCQVSLTSVPEVLLADMDLIVVDDRHQVRTNNSHVDNTEIVEFTVTAPSSTSVQVKTRLQYWDPCTDGSRKTHMAIAWDVLPAGTE